MVWVLDSSHWSHVLRRRQNNPRARLFPQYRNILVHSEPADRMPLLVRRHRRSPRSNNILPPRLQLAYQCPDQAQPDQAGRHPLTIRIV